MSGTLSEKVYFFPLRRRADGIFCSLEEGGLQGRELPLVSELNQFILENYNKTLGVFELSGRLYEGDVFVPRIEDDHSYTIINENGIPVFATTSDVAPSEAQLAAFSNAAQKLEYSEAISPQESIFISDSFIEPGFEEIDSSGNSLRRLSWATLRDMPRVIVVGAPGAGKTTTLRRLGLEHLDRSKIQDGHPWPVYVQMRHLHEGSGVEQIVRTNLFQQYTGNVGSTSSDLGLSGRHIVLLLDGLDEIPEYMRDSAINAISEFASKYPTVSIVASTREAGYNWQIPSFRYARILPFSIAKIREWCYYRLKPDAITPWRSFVTNLEERHELMALASNPLLLSLAISLYRRNSYLPQNRSSLLKSYFDAVTDQWDSVRGVVRQRDLWAHSTHKVAALCRAAYGVRSSGRESFTTAEFNLWNAAYGANASLLFVCERDTGVVTQHQVDGLWFFTHRTLADYLAARYVVEHTGDVKKSLGKIFETGDWSDIWAYSCGITQDASDLVSIVLSHRKISRAKKLEALGVAFEQDVIVSSHSTKASMSFIKSVIQRSFSQDTPNFIVKIQPRTNSRKHGLSFRKLDDSADTSVNIEALLRSLKRLRNSTLGHHLIEWLHTSKNKDLKRLAEILSSEDVVSLSVKPTSRGTVMTMELLEDLQNIQRVAERGE